MDSYEDLQSLHFPQSMDSDNNAHNHWFLITQAPKRIVLHVVVSDKDVCNWNGKPSSLPSHIVNLLL